MDQEESTEIAVTISPELTKIISENNLIELPKATQHAAAFAANMSRVHELSKALSTMNKDNPSDTDAKVARLNRLAMVKNRTAAAKIKEERKSGLITESKLVDNLHNVIKHSSELIEAEYEKIEKFAENKEKERRESLRIERIELLTPYTENADKFDLANMEEQTFNELFSGIKMQKEAKEAADKKVQEEKEEKERIEKLRSQRSIEIQPYAQFFENAESVSLGEISQDEYNKLYIDLQEKKKDYDVMIENQRLENEKLKEQAAIKESRTSEMMPFSSYISDFNAILSLSDDEYQVQLSAIKNMHLEDLKAKESEKLKLESEINKRTETAYKFLLKNGFKHSSGGVVSVEFGDFISVTRYSNFESDTQLEDFKNTIIANNERDKKAKAQEVENARLAKELQDKKDAEEKAAADKLAEDKAKEKAAKYLLKAGDKTRINKWIDEMSIPQINTNGMTPESIEKVSEIISTFDKYKAWAKKEGEKI